jgi:integrase
VSPSQILGDTVGNRSPRSPLALGTVASIEERKRSKTTPAKWRVVWREGKDRHSETFSSPESAAEFKAFVEAAGNHCPPGWTPGYGWAGTFTPPLPAPVEGERSITTAAFVLASAARRVQASVGTRRTYAEITRRYISGSELGVTPWLEVTAATVSDWILELRALGISPKTIRNIHGLASGAFKEALLAGTARRNPFVGLAPKSKTHSEDTAVFMSPAQIETVIAACPPHYQLLVYLLFASGLRWGEATALAVKHFDRKTGAVNVHRAWKETDAGVYVLGEPKTDNSRRTVKLDAETAGLIETSLAGKAAEDFVFTTPAGEPVGYTHFYNTVWRGIICPLLPVADFPKRPRIHDARHTHASLLAAAGHSLYVVSRRLGHESVATTAGIYTHLFPEEEGGLADSMGEILPPFPSAV